MTWATLADLAAEPSPQLSQLWLLMVGFLGIACISPWILFRLWRDKSVQGARLIRASVWAALPAVFATAFAVSAIDSYQRAQDVHVAAQEHRCAWGEGIITHHTRPGELDHGSMSFTVNGETYFYDEFSPGFRGPLCASGAPCDGDYVRVCRYKSYILVLQKRVGR